MPKPRLSVFTGADVTGAEIAQDGSPHRTSRRKSGSGDTSPARVEHELDRVSGTLSPRTVSVRLATIVPLLLDAVEHNRSWLSDFSDDTVRLDVDLYDVLLAYQELRDEAVA